MSTTKKILLVDVYSTVWGWDTENAYYEGTDMWAYMLAHSVVADQLEAVKGSGYITEGLKDGSRRYTIRDL